MERPTARDDADSDLATWKKRLADLPDLRWDKVAAVRQAMREGRYEVGLRLDQILPELHNDVGVLCRRETAPPE